MDRHHREGPGGAGAHLEGLFALDPAACRRETGRQVRGRARGSAGAPDWEVEPALILPRAGPKAWAKGTAVLGLINAPTHNCGVARACLVRACVCADADSAPPHLAAAARCRRALVRSVADPAADDLARPAHRLGGEEPLPPLPARGGLP